MSLKSLPYFNSSKRTFFSLKVALCGMVVSEGNLSSEHRKLVNGNWSAQ